MVSDTDTTDDPTDTDRPADVPTDALPIGLHVTMASSGRGKFDVLYRGIGGTLVDVSGGAHDAVFDVLSQAFNRFAAAEHADPDRPVGWVWQGDDGLQIRPNPAVAEEYDPNKWATDPAAYGYVGYENE